MEYKKEILDGYNLHIINTSKFKTTHIGIRFKDTLDRQTVTYRSLLPFVLKAQTDKYTSKKAVYTRLEELYGASFSAKVVRYGKCNVINFDMRIVNEKFLKSETSLLEESCEFINDIITNHSKFSEDILEEEKRLLDIEFEQEKSNKTRYALNQLFETMLENETYRIKAMGLREDIADITVDNLFEEYKTMLTNNEIDVIICGDLSKEQIDTVKSIFKFNGVKRNIPHIDTEDKVIDIPVIREEVIDVSQGKLNIGYRTFIRMGDSLEYAANVYNSILGGSANSKLFMSVREKHSLAYYCSSGIDLNKGLMYIYAGIESDKYHKTVEIIKEQLADMVAGKFTQDEIDESKQTILNDYYEALDSQGSLIAKAYFDAIKGLEFDIPRVEKGINSVTKEQIIEVAKKVQEDATFFLTNKAVV